MGNTLSRVSTSQIARRLAGSRTFWATWLRRPALDVAESVLRLRRLRGMSQAQLARRLKTSQPAVARIESGRANVRLSTLRDLGKALDATVAIHLVPVELHHTRAPRWWDWATAQSGLPQQQFNFIQMNVNFLMDRRSEGPEVALLDNAQKTPLDLKHNLFQMMSASGSGGS